MQLKIIHNCLLSWFLRYVDTSFNTRWGILLKQRVNELGKLNLKKNHEYEKYEYDENAIYFEQSFFFCVVVLFKFIQLFEVKKFRNLVFIIFVHN